MSSSLGTAPNFLVVGAQKSGTTTLMDHLAAHPDVFALTREVHYFDRNLQRGIDWYRGHFSEANGQRAIGEGTPEYLYDEHVAPELAEALPGARLIAILRDPVDRAYSQYWHNRTRGHEPLGFEEALAAEAERLENPDPVARARFAYKDRGYYRRQLMHLCEHVPRDLLLVVLFGDLRARRQEMIQSVYGFLGIDDTFVPPRLGVTRNQFVTFRSQRLRRPIRRLPMPLRRVAVRANTRRRASYPPMDPATRSELTQVFQPENYLLASWLGRDVLDW